MELLCSPAYPSRRSRSPLGRGVAGLGLGRAVRGSGGGCCLGQALAGGGLVVRQPSSSAVTRRSCRDTGMMHLVRCLFFLEAGYDFAAHPPGRENMLADDLFAFVSKVRSPDPQPVPLELLLDPTGWTSPRWTRRFCAIA